MADGFDELADFLRKTDPSDFRPAAYLEPETDCFILNVRNVPSYSKRVNQVFTLFLAHKDNTLVGCEIKGVSGILRRSKRFLGVIVDHKIKLAILIALALAPEPDDDIDDYETALDQLREYADDQ